MADLDFSPEAGPVCTMCGKQAFRQDIDGDWWPPCLHATTRGLATLRYLDSPGHPFARRSSTEKTNDP